MRVRINYSATFFLFPLFSWVMSAIDKIGFRRMPPVGVLPLGTGNDLSRSLDWGPGYTDTCLKKILNQIERANVEHMDRWHIETSDPVVELPLNVMNNYFSIGVDAKTSLKFHSERGECVSAANTLLIIRFFAPRGQSRKIQLAFRQHGQVCALWNGRVHQVQGGNVEACDACLRWGGPYGKAA